MLSWSWSDMGERVVIVALGACTAIGPDAWSSAAAVRAGVAGFVQHPYMIDTAGEPMRAAIVPWIEIGLCGTDRLEALLFSALDQALEPLQSNRVAPFTMAIALGLPSARPGLPADIQRQMLSRINKRHGRLFSSAAAFEAGHAAGLIALQAANAKLAQGALDACVVAGVDSYIEHETLEWLEANDQLHSTGPLNNAWGFVPGEAGSALLLMRESVAKAAGLNALAVVLGMGTTMEPKRIKTQTVCIGEGLTAAFRHALAALPAGTKVSDIYCDMNGEPYRADEFGFTALRTKESFESASDFIAPADCWGDVGAAGGPLHLMLAVSAGQKGYATGPLAFAWASAEMGERAGVLLACDAAGACRP
jgi:3-oxoacyl-[acyl-carrier-protein] synthase I